MPPNSTPEAAKTNIESLNRTQTLSSAADTAPLHPEIDINPLDSQLGNISDLQSTLLLRKSEEWNFTQQALGLRGRLLFVEHDKVNGVAPLSSATNDRMAQLRHEINSHALAGRIPLVLSRQTEFSLEEWNILNDLVYRAGGTLRDLRKLTLEEFSRDLPKV